MNQVIEDIHAWRKQMRKEYLARRLMIDTETYQAMNRIITHHLKTSFGFLSNFMTGFCWPFKNEFDARFFIKILRDQGGHAALPSVIAMGEPLEFREWWPGVEMKPGVFNIPVPQHTPLVLPQALLVPPVGFDDQGYRLGYGGAFFDRTIARLAKKSAMPLKIGVAFDLCHMDTIHPLHHDIPMDFIITESGVRAPSPAGLIPIEPADVVQRLDCRFSPQMLKVVV